jgi:para-aminobenzoate synthetase component 1
MQATAFLEAPWREPLDVLSALAEEPWTIGFLSGGPEGRWSYVAARPDATLSITADNAHESFDALAALAGGPGGADPEGPPFQGGVAGLASYELGARIERLAVGQYDGWPDLACARYSAILAFDHRGRRVIATGRGVDQATAKQAAGTANSWLTLSSRARRAPAGHVRPDDPRCYEGAVAQVVERIRAGELFQANVARRWTGRLAAGAQPFDLLAELVSGSPAPFASYLRLPGRAVVSNSPEQFLRIVPQAGRLNAETRPIKGTAPRGLSPEEDEHLALGLATSLKDRAENLMIVDLMRNDLAKVCEPGTVRTPELFRLARFTNVHHLISTVVGRLAEGRTTVDLLRAAFPPGSITGAPKVQAMKVIAQLEAPRGPFFGAMFHLGADGAFDSSVLIRTAALVEEAGGWRMEARAGAGIVSDSDPAGERRETEFKISALAAAMVAV